MNAHDERVARMLLGRYRGQVAEISRDLRALADWVDRNGEPAQSAATAAAPLDYVNAAALVIRAVHQTVAGMGVTALLYAARDVENLTPRPEDG